MEDAFNALDDILFDLQPFTVQGTVAETSEPLDKSSFLLDSSFADDTTSNDSLVSDAISKQYTCSPYPMTLKSKEDLESISTHHDDVLVFDHESLKRKVYSWLSQLPDIPGPELRCVNAYSDACTIASIARPTQSMGQGRECIPEIERLMRHMDLFNDSDRGDYTTSSIAEEGHEMQRDVLVNEESEDCILADVGATLDGYHEALLHIQMLLSPADNHISHFRPSLRRRYPRGLEEEARKDIELIAS
ncbi:hypothetical protein H9L39_17407 [Fusarium oxysporum f. sp. albedinis]|nr:hypothetical protein H9L39_17407 [Fusarium oxysporum f. sp. albedinis]